jgi:hypothetical protein
MASPQHTLGLHQYDPHIKGRRVKPSPDYTIPVPVALAIVVRSHEALHDTLIYLNSAMYNLSNAESI